jgi:hypothetical protein
MQYSESSAVNRAYELIAAMSEPAKPDDARQDEAMVMAAALEALGEDRSWASVWWAYGAIHYDMSDEALDRALDLLSRVDRSDDARAAAIMLRAEILQSKAIYASVEPSIQEQFELLEEAVSLAPEWPSLRLRLARASRALGDDSETRRHASAARSLLAHGATGDPFDSAITGRNLDPEYVRRALDELGA